MKFTAKRSDILREAELAMGVVETKTIIPVLANFRLEALNGGIKLQATDLELAISTEFEAEVGQPGAMTIPARRLVEILKALPEGDVAFELLDNHWSKITSGKARFKLAGVAADNFPAFPAGPTEFTPLPIVELGEAIRKTSFAISREQSRYTLNGALLIINPAGVAMVATDGHRLALKQDSGFRSHDSGKETRVLIPRAALGVLAALIDKRATVPGSGAAMFSQDESHLFFEVGSRTLVSRQLTGQFPNYEAVLPKENGKIATVDAAALTNAVKRVGLAADERSHAVKLALSSGKLEIESPGTESGEAHDTIDAEYSGESVVAGFNYRYILDFLATVTGQVRVMLKDESSAAELRPAGDGYRYILMPMRV